MSSGDKIEAIKDADTLRAVAHLLEAENRRLHARLAEQTKEIAKLKGQDDPQQLGFELLSLQEQMKRLQQKMFGASSERRSKNKSTRDDAPPKRGHGPSKQPTLPIHEVTASLAEDEKQCDACGGQLEEMAGQTEDSELITVVERSFRVQTIKRQKYNCKCKSGIVTAPPPVKHIPGGRYSLEFAALVAMDKYAKHLPLDRQRRDMQRLGLKITSQALWDQIAAFARYLEPAYKAIAKYILGSDVIGMDETRWLMMLKKNSKKWWVWTMTCANAVFYKIDPSRSADVAVSLIDDFRGAIVCDGYRAYETLAAKSPGVELALCWSHARRYYIEAEPNYPQCAHAIELIDELFAIDRLTPDPALLEGDEKLDEFKRRHRLRTELAPPILRKLKVWANKQTGLPKSGIRKAIDYMNNHWLGLTAFLENPLIPLDNNASERAMRGPVSA